MRDPWDRVDALMREGLGRVFPAAVLVVALNETACFQRAYGQLDPDAGHQPTQLDTRFDLASLTKLFTATAFMWLVETGRVGLDQPLVTVIPQLGGRRPIGDTEDPLSRALMPVSSAHRGQTVDAGAVTFRHVLTHTSGLAAWRSLFRDLRGVPFDQRRQRTLELVCGYDFAYPSGQLIVYSDLGFILLGEAVACLTDQPLDQAVKRLVLDPLGLTYTAYCPIAPTVRMGDHDRVCKLASIAPTEICPWRGRRLRGEVHDENAGAVGGISGHAGLFAPAHDVLALGRCFLRRGEPLLRSESVSQMTRLQAAIGDRRRGLAWLLAGDELAPYADFLGPDAYGHTGFTGTSLWVAPRSELVVVLLTNRVYYGRDNGEAIADFRYRLHRTVASVIKQE